MSKFVLCPTFALFFSPLRACARKQDSMKTIAQNQKYELIYESAKNRLFFVARGHWDMQTAQNYHNDFRKALRYTQKNYTIVADMRLMQAFPAEVQRIVVQAQASVVRNELLAMVYVAPPGNIVCELQLETMARRAGISHYSFPSPGDAERWLDEEMLALQYV